MLFQREYSDLSKQKKPASQSSNVAEEFPAGMFRWHIISFDRAALHANIVDT